MGGCGALLSFVLEEDDRDALSIIQLHFEL